MHDPSDAGRQTGERERTAGVPAEIGTDCCASCVFNGINQGRPVFAPHDAAGFRCEIRQFQIASPFLTQCSNHQRRNPLMRRTPRGLAWTSAIPRFLFTKAANRFPWALSPPKTAWQAYMLPFFEDLEPGPGGPDKCWVCQAEARATIRLLLRDGGFRTFCGTGHYLDWWIIFAPEAQVLMDKDPLDEETVKERLKPMGPKLFRANYWVENNNPGPVLEMLSDLDDLFVELNYIRLDPEQAASAVNNYNGDITTLGSYSPYLLRLYADYIEMARLLWSHELEGQKLLQRLAAIRELLRRYLAGEPYPVSPDRRPLHRR